MAHPSQPEPTRANDFGPIVLLRVRKELLKQVLLKEIEPPIFSWLLLHCRQKSPIELWMPRFDAHGQVTPVRLSTPLPQKNNQAEPQPQQCNSWKGERRSPPARPLRGDYQQPNQARSRPTRSQLAPQGQLLLAICNGLKAGLQVWVYTHIKDYSTTVQDVTFCLPCPAPQSAPKPLAADKQAFAC